MKMLIQTLAAVAAGTVLATYAFAAWEQPQLFLQEVRAGFRPVRAKV